MLKVAIAARFLRASLFQTMLIIAGIGVGIAVQIFVGSLIGSLQADLIDSTVGSSPQVTLLPEDGTTLSGSLAVTASQDPEVTVAIPVRKLSAIYVSGESSYSLSVTAGTQDDIDALYRLSERIAGGMYALEDGAILIGSGFSDETGIAAGDTVALTLPDGATAEYRVSGVFDLGAAAANDRFAFLSAGSAAAAMGLGPEQYSAIEIQVRDVFASSEVVARLAGEGTTAVDWQTENEELLSGLAAQSGSAFMIQAFVMIAVALGIASTLAISAVQKTRQIGILKAMGMTDRSAGLIFLAQAAILGVVGVIAGIVIGYVLIWGFSFAPVDFSVTPSPTLILVSATVGVLVALASSIIPSRSTSRLDPIEVIQNG